MSQFARRSIFLLLSVLIFACSNNDKNVDPITPKGSLPIVLPDSIIYTALKPDLLLETELFYTPSQVLLRCPDVPTPFDSSAILMLDIDQDLNPDIMIECLHRINNSPHGHCLRFDYLIKASGTDTSIKFRSNTINPFDISAVEYSMMDTVIADSSWSNNNYLQIESPSAPFNVSLFDNYIGFKKSKKYG